MTRHWHVGKKLVLGIGVLVLLLVISGMAAYNAAWSLQTSERARAIFVWASVTMALSLPMAVGVAWWVIWVEARQLREAALELSGAMAHIAAAMSSIAGSQAKASAILKTLEDATARAGRPQPATPKRPGRILPMPRLIKLSSQDSALS